MDISDLLNGPSNEPTSYHAATSFPQFARLPPELRQMIWRLCRPSRVIEMEIPSSTDFNCKVSSTSLMNRCAPIITRVCREARMVALESEMPRGEPGAYDFTKSLQEFMQPPTWVVAGRDVILFSVEEDPLEYINARGVGVTVYPGNRRALERSAEEAKDNRDKWQRLANDIRPLGAATTLDRQSCFDMFIQKGEEEINDMILSVCVRIVCIHASPQEAVDSELFGLLGDAPVVLVDAADRDRMLQYWDFWEDHNSHTDRTSAGFFSEYCQHDTWAQRESEALIRRCLMEHWCDLHKDVGGDRRARWKVPPGNGSRGVLDWEHPWVKKALQSIPTFRPTIMFRLCTASCLESHSLLPALASGTGGLASRSLRAL